uniref:Uncharacterized protein n=1 Tax=Aegilops tauschii subsp. strangulata TaxID=200361 RepID=A0A453P7M7_AEGTS
MLSLLCFGTKRQTSTTTCAPSIKYLPSQASAWYFQVHYMEENLLEYIDLHDDTLIARLIDGIYSPNVALC